MLGKIIREWLKNASEQRSTQLVLDQKIVLTTDVGLTRTENQDRVAVLFFRPDNPLLKPFICVALSDGMGGMINGAECATIAIAELFSSLIGSTESSGFLKLKQGVLKSNVAVYTYANGNGGATLSAILIETNGIAYYANVGDSRIYAVPNDKSDLVRVTIDDTLQEAFGGQGRELVQYIGIGAAMVPHVDLLPRYLQSVFVTSDGAHYFDANVFKEIILQADNPKRASERIIALARWLGGPDNATIAAFRPSEISSILARDPSSAVTIWSGAGELQLPYALSQMLESTDQKSDPIPEKNDAPTYGICHRRAPRDRN
jgi:serine/threonine protein phosphatase PrpC